MKLTNYVVNKVNKKTTVQQLALTEKYNQKGNPPAQFTWVAENLENSDFLSI